MDWGLQERITGELQTAFGGSGIKSFLLESVLGSLQVHILLLNIWVTHHRAMNYCWNGNI